MATGKKYYWIRLDKNFMTGDTVDFLMSQDNGAMYVVLYQMLCFMCINTGGKMETQICDMIIPFDVEKIERDCKYFNRDTIIVALSLFKKLGLIYEQDNGCLMISNFDKIVGSETDYAIQKRNQRSGQLVDKSVDIVHTEIRDKEIRDKEITDKKKEKKNTVFVPPTLEEVREYCEARGNGIDPEEFIAFYESKGWFVGKSKMVNWKSSVITWEKSRKKSQKTKTVFDEWRDA